MKTFSKIAAQGEITLRKVTTVPSDATPLKADSIHYIVGHSETGHHHVLLAERTQMFEGKAPDGMRVLYAILDGENVLEHLRDFDTHEPIKLEPGIYEFRIGREYDPYAEIARRQAD